MSRHTEWLILAAGLISSSLVLAWMVWTERTGAWSADADRMRAQALDIDQTLHRQLEGIRWALDGSRAALAQGSGCDLACRRTLLQSLKRAMPGVRALLAVGPGGRVELSDDDLGDPASTTGTSSPRCRACATGAATAPSPRS